MAFPIKLSQFINFHREPCVESVTLKKEKPKLFPSSFQFKFERVVYFKVIASTSKNFPINVVEQDIPNQGYLTEPLNPLYIVENILLAKVLSIASGVGSEMEKWCVSL